MYHCCHNNDGCDVLNPDENHPVVSEALRIAKKRNLEMSEKMVLVRTRDANGITSTNAACNGDSGGPVYKFEEKNETFKIVGVNSARLAFLWFDIGFYFTRLDRHSTIHPSPQNCISDVIAGNISPEILP